MSIRKKFGLIFLFLILNTFLIIGYLAVRNATFLNTLRSESLELSNLDLTKDKYNMKIKTSGSYAIVEKAMKSYLSDYAKLLQSTLAIMDDDKLVKILSYDNYVNDGPLFVNSLKYLDTEKEKFNKNIDKLLADSQVSNINSYINKKINDKYYKDLYVELMSNAKIKSNFNEAKALLEEAKININNIFDISKEVLTFLVNSKDYWKLEDGQIKFLNSDLYNQYITLVSKV